VKARIGFVSNSSSSSFCIIGVDGGKFIKQLIKAEGKDYEYNEKKDEYKDSLDYGTDEGRVVTFYGSDNEPSYAGINIESFGEDITIKEMKNQFMKKVKKQLKIDIPLEKIKLHTGECSSG